MSKGGGGPSQAEVLAGQRQLQQESFASQEQAALRAEERSAERREQERLEELEEHVELGRVCRHSHVHGHRFGVAAVAFDSGIAPASKFGTRVVIVRVEHGGLVHFRLLATLGVDN